MRSPGAAPDAGGMAPLLEVRAVTKRFGGLVANQAITFDVAPGEIVGVIGPNGAGKTTIFNAVTGITTLTAGQVLFDGEERQRPLTRKVIAGVIGVGVVTAVFALITAAGIEQLWSAAIRRPFAEPQAQFSLGVALSAAADYLQGKPSVSQIPDSDKW